jgi:hypothetical protein
MASSSGEVVCRVDQVAAYSRPTQVAPIYLKRTEHTLSRWDQLASLIHEFELHVVLGYQRWSLAKDWHRFGQGEQPS